MLLQLSRLNSLFRKLSMTRETYAPKVQTVPTIAATLLLHVHSCLQTKKLLGYYSQEPTLLSAMRFLAVVSNAPLSVNDLFLLCPDYSGPDGQVALAIFDSHFVLTLGGLASGALGTLSRDCA